MRSTPGSGTDCASLQQIIERHVRSRPEANALWWQGVPTSYRALQTRIEQLSRALAGSGDALDRVAVLAWNCPAFVELTYAVPAAGRILVPLNARLAPAELCDQLRRSGARRLFADPQLLAAVQGHPGFDPSVEAIALGDNYEQWLATATRGNAVGTAGGDPAWILFTSGSTGKPKGAVLTHASFLAGLRSAALGRPVDPQDRYFYPFPLFHVAAHNVLLQHLYGAAVVLAPSFDAGDTLRACRELGVTTMSLAPTMIAMLLEHPEFEPQDLASVRTIGYGAAAMPQTLLRRLLDETGVGLCQSYGMTELSGSVSFLTVEDHRAAAQGDTRLLASVGRPLPTAQLRIVDPYGAACAPGQAGEILVRAAQCMDSYWQDTAATAQALQDGWLHTGDIGRLDDNGYLYIVDRVKDMILSGGENIASREVEEVLRGHPAVADCAVIGQPDPQWGERVCAVLVLRDDTTDASLEQHCREFIAGYKTPRRWFRVDNLPLNASGKVDKPALRRRFE